MEYTLVTTSLAMHFAIAFATSLLLIRDLCERYLTNISKVMEIPHPKMGENFIAY